MVAPDGTPIVIDAPGAQTFLAVAAEGRVIPAVASAVDDGRIVLPDDQAHEVAQRWRAAMDHCLRVEATLLWLAGELDELGIEIRVLKGSAVAHLDYPDPSLRQFGDLDVLVRSGDLDRVVRLLEHAGLRRRFPEPRPGFAARYWKSVSLRGDIEVDVHRTLADGPIGPRLPVDDLWAEPEIFRVAGRDFSALAAEHRLLHSCLHAYLGPPPARLASLADVARGIAGLDPDAVREVARRWRVEPALVGAIGEFASTGGWPAGASRAWLTPDDRTMFDAAAFASHRRVAPSWVTRSLINVLALPGWRERAGYVAGLAWPDREYRRGRHDDAGGRLRHGLGELRGSWRR